MVRTSLRRAPLVVVASPDEVLADADVGLLGVAERARSAALQDPADRAAYVAAHLLVRRCAAALTGRPLAGLAVHQWCADCRTAGHGRPSLADVPGVHVSWSHSRGAVVAAAAWRPVGVDVEGFPVAAAAAGGFPGLAPAEQQQVRSAVDPSLLALRHWARKECLVKAGTTTLAGMGRVDLSRLAERRDRAGRAVSRYRGLYLTDWCDPAREALVAVAGAGAPVVRALADVAAAGAAVGR
ncbi:MULTISPECIES: 4'-phosphopantetheinyl transferase family protein [unclassified Modestobacter]|uniref:4'-phosphopantetheinyl transferase family protein n=1 Tax=unclassified Modestobacter TaxID=2643866 RepID=UPI0022A9FFF6|nr:MULTISPECIES: 4'-phosphopantetheinyl transferase superfamily protein [unclassified Modestobacter]MCZ2827172.1 4'-phosphopantetheinyl transferase superfamily protein [Modestobacter sp. VKM Ac-2981]MCZ2854920.1 4'-phosphopantetheinyl transferase superfamily protein [Modestobacter sp. VKM Ac-2982]